MAHVMVYHDTYGCETGCCGHTVQLVHDDGAERTEFLFDHPWSKDKMQFAKDLVAEAFGAEHVADLDWEHCYISED